MTTHSTLKTGSAYNFQLTAQTGHASYAVDISAPSGWRRQVSGVHPDSQNVFAINESEFSPDETNFVRVKIESPEPSGYSAPVSLSYDPDVTDSSANQIRTVSISRNGTHIVLRWSLNQANGKQTKLYFQRTDTGTTYLLTPQALNASVTSFTLDSQALASPCGQFWGTQFQTGVETGPGPSSDLGSSRPGEQGTQDGCGSPPPPSPAPATKFVNAYRHLDHLGSLRIARGDSGAVEAGVSSALDLYPYGTPFAASAAESSRQFTGHERDEATGQDYMLARYQGTGLARFLSTDPGDDTDTEVPLSWNKYTYVRDNPLKFLDPDGKATELHSKVSTYPVAGKTATEAWANAKAANSDGFPGHTTWSMAITSLESVEAGGGSHGAAVSIPIDVTVTVTATVSVPTWSAPAEASPGEQSAFDAASASLMKHEEGHVKIAKQGGEALEKAVMNVVGVGKGATQHQAAANAKSDLTRKVVAAQRDQREATKKKQKNYDKKTDHGKKP
jgi:RHS repeat-associated protein